MALFASCVIQSRAACELLEELQQHPSAEQSAKVAARARGAMKGDDSYSPCLKKIMSFFYRSVLRNLLTVVQGWPVAHHRSVNATHV